ncbi:uncharacterized protein LOC134294592 isoform X3 [Anolis carolinensis]|uniref:uncharacterized protein LOC134294592 isoform X3 n=1 Tax=Anolis carolinensis TaxID=28377 RepID=UPI002F2B81BD
MASKAKALAKPAVAKTALAKPAVAKTAAAKPAVDKPAVDKPAVAKTALAKPTVDKPAADEPAADKPAVDKPAVAKTALAKTALAKPAAAKPAVDKPAADEPAVDKPAMDKPAAVEPAAAKPAAMADTKGKGGKARAKETAQKIHQRTSAMATNFPFNMASPKKLWTGLQVAAAIGVIVFIISISIYIFLTSANKLRSIEKPMNHLKHTMSIGMRNRNMNYANYARLSNEVVKLPSHIENTQREYGEQKKKYQLHRCSDCGPFLDWPHRRKRGRPLGMVRWLRSDDRGLGWPQAELLQGPRSSGERLRLRRAFPWPLALFLERR